MINKSPPSVYTLGPFTDGNGRIGRDDGMSVLEGNVQSLLELKLTEGAIFKMCFS